MALENYTLTKEARKDCLDLLKMFKLDGERADKKITEGQLRIFHALVFKPAERVHIMTSTQYGKSRIVAMACVVITCIFDEVVSVIAPTNEKAKIIMRYYTEHLGDNKVFESQLEKDTRLERLRLEGGVG